jgi:hypothetical protein
MKSKRPSTSFRVFSTLLSLTVIASLASTPAHAKDANELVPTPTNAAPAKPAAESESEFIQPQDTSYRSLKQLSAKYGCETTLAGNRPLTRDEFASNLNTCVEAMEQTIALDRRKKRKPLIKRRPRVVAPAPVEADPVVPETTTPAAPPAPEQPVQPPAPPAAPEVSQQDLEQLRELVQSFSSELKAYDAKLQAVEAKTVALKDQNFSTTTKLVGEAIFAVTGLSGGPATATGRGNTILGDRLRLNFRTSFTGKDMLVTRLQSRSNVSFAGGASGTNMTRLGFEGDNGNATELHRLQYQLPLASTTKVYLEAVGSEFNDNIYTFNPEHQSAGTGSVTRFGRFNPIYRLSGEGAGLTLDHKFSPGVGVVLGYAVPRVVTPATPGTAATPVAATGALESANTTGNGLFGGSNVFFSQLAVKPSDGFNLGLIYARSYNSTGTLVSGNNGSSIANNPFASSTAGVNAAGAAVGGINPTTANHYSVLASLDLSPDVILSGWGGLTQANRENGVGSADIWNYAGTLAFKNVGSKGSTLGFVVGMPPKLTSNSGATAARIDPATSLHLEAFYKYKLSDNLSITPGILVLTNPEHNSNNPTEYLGTIRTTFSF